MALSAHKEIDEKLLERVKTILFDNVFDCRFAWNFTCTHCEHGREGFCVMFKAEVPEKAIFRIEVSAIFRPSEPMTECGRPKEFVAPCFTLSKKRSFSAYFPNDMTWTASSFASGCTVSMDNIALYIKEWNLYAEYLQNTSPRRIGAALRDIAVDVEAMFLADEYTRFFGENQHPVLKVVAPVYEIPPGNDMCTISVLKKTCFNCKGNVQGFSDASPLCVCKYPNA